MNQPPVNGSVLGIDVGYSEKRKTTCFCLFDWDNSNISLSFQKAGIKDKERQDVLQRMVSRKKMAGVAIDGPLTHGLRLVSHYRSAEALLSRGVLQKRGKPAQTSSPVGQKLHQHATTLANLTLNSTSISVATHFQAIHLKRVVEAFPNAFLAALIPEIDLPRLNRDASDRYWESIVIKTNRLEQLVNLLLPGRKLQFNLRECRDHEHRAGIICALTALTVVRGLHVGLGDPIDGDIILPPLSSWGPANHNATSSSWMEACLLKNIPKVQAARRSHPNHQQARLTHNTGPWI